jgi:hypothetical protein
MESMRPNYPNKSEGTPQFRGVMPLSPILNYLKPNKTAFRHSGADRGTSPFSASIPSSHNITFVKTFTGKEEKGRRSTRLLILSTKGADE